MATKDAAHEWAEIEIVEEVGGAAARAAIAAGCGPGRGPDVGSADWEEVQRRLGRRVYGYSPEGRRLALAFLAGWGRAAGE